MATRVLSVDRTASRRALMLGVIAGVLAALCVTPARAEAPASGRRLYREYCAACHGVSGRGDGPDAAIFSTPPRNLHNGFLRKYKTEDLLRRVREGRPLELALDLPALRARAGEVETLAAYIRRLPTVDWPLAQQGEEIFMDRCAVCHGPTGHPGPTRPRGVRVPPDLGASTRLASMDEEELISLVRHGRKGMPALTPRVPEADGPPLAAFVRLLSPGFDLYSRYCASCHGEDGQGPGKLAEGIRRPVVPFDRAFFSQRDPDQLRTGIWHMLADEKPRMPHYRTLLDETQARAIVEYLKRTQ